MRGAPSDRSAGVRYLRWLVAVALILLGMTLLMHEPVTDVPRGAESEVAEQAQHTTENASSEPPKGEPGSGTSAAIEVIAVDACSGTLIGDAVMAIDGGLPCPLPGVLPASAWSKLHISANGYVATTRSSAAPSLGSQDTMVVPMRRAVTVRFSVVAPASTAPSPGAYLTVCHGPKQVWEGAFDSSAFPVACTVLGEGDAYTVTAQAGSARAHADFKARDGLSVSLVLTPSAQLCVDTSRLTRTAACRVTAVYSQGRSRTWSVLIHPGESKWTCGQIVGRLEQLPAVITLEGPSASEPLETMVGPDDVTRHEVLGAIVTLPLPSSAVEGFSSMRWRCVDGQGRLLPRPMKGEWEGVEVIAQSYDEESGLTTTWIAGERDECALTVTGEGYWPQRCLATQTEVTTVVLRERLVRGEIRWGECAPSSKIIVRDRSRVVAEMAAEPGGGGTTLALRSGRHSVDLLSAGRRVWTHEILVPESGGFVIGVSWPRRVDVHGLLSALGYSSAYIIEEGRRLSDEWLLVSLERPEISLAPGRYRVRGLDGSISRLQLSIGADGRSEVEVGGDSRADSAQHRVVGLEEVIADVERFMGTQPQAWGVKRANGFSHRGGRGTPVDVPPDWEQVWLEFPDGMICIDALAILGEPIRAEARRCTLTPGPDARVRIDGVVQELAPGIAWRSLVEETRQTGGRSPGAGAVPAGEVVVLEGHRALVIGAASDGASMVGSIMVTGGSSELPGTQRVALRGAVPDSGGSVQCVEVDGWAVPPTVGRPYRFRAVPAGPVENGTVMAWSWNRAIVVTTADDGR